MILPIYVDDVIAIQRKLNSANRALTNCRYRSGKSKEYLNFGSLSSEEIAAFEQVIMAKAEKGDKHYLPVSRKFKEWKTLLSDTGTEKPIKKLDLIAAGIKAFFADKPHKWVFRQEQDGSVNPYFITDVQYYPARYDNWGNYHPAHVILTAKAYNRGSQTSITATWYKADLGKTPRQLLHAKGLFVETEEAVLTYKEAYKRYVDLRDQTGLQMEAIGDGIFQSKQRWSFSASVISMVREGIPTKVVIEDLNESSDSDSRDQSESTSINDSFWGEIPNRNGMADLDDEEIAELLNDQDSEPNRVELPVHTYLRVFDMDKHDYLRIHVGNLNPYPWNKSLIDKLIIKQQDKDLIDLLMNQTGNAVEDIIRGKMSGVIVLATGLPGIGKTLTAEVFSEMIEKPLYTVQCSQLGLNVNEIESNLKNILDRASRWNAILLIDEADVYIRRRDNDIQQNAIVGVFLRLIEYYRGVLFMTSNRGNEIDDAIISRATAWIRYEMPSKDLLGEIWKVLAKQYGAKFSDADVKVFLKELPNISGRTVRNLLKLARLLAGPDGSISVENVLMVSQYQQLESE